MKTEFFLFACIAIMAGILYALAPSLRKPWHITRKARGLLKGGIFCANAYGATGYWPNGRKTLLADAAHSARHLLCKAGTDSGHIAVISAASDEPLGFCIDEPDAAEAEATLQLAGLGPDTVIGIAGEAVTAWEPAYSKGDGKLMDQPTSAGTFWRVGTFLEDGASGAEVAVWPSKPQKIIVVANASTLSQTQAAMIDGAIVIVLGA
jgi:hypothetical protein